MISDAVRIRVIRAIIGMTSESFAESVGASVNSVTNWEKGRTHPQQVHRVRLGMLCQKYRLCFLPSGMPVPMDDVIQFKKNSPIRR